MIKTKVITALDAVAATSTSNKFYVGGAKRIGFLFRRGSHASGNHVFTVNIGGESEDTTTPTMLATNMLIGNTAATNSQTTAHVASVTLSANGDAYAWLDPLCLVTWVSVTATETTDGVATAFIILEVEE
jgi:hypothetical protein